MTISTLTLTCYIIPFFISITFTIEFAFAIPRIMFRHGFSFIFVCYHIKCFNIYVFCFFWNTYFWSKDISPSSTLIYTNHEWIIFKLNRI